MGLALARSGRLYEAVTAYTDALAALRHAGDRQGEGTTLRSFGSILVESGRAGEAARTLTDAIAVCRETDGPPWRGHGAVRPRPAPVPGAEIR
ncbi:tetratricopeptide repeat protein [Streptomyces virginiae]|uniref:tetratricopeptide repeat protein n=1 Tax=Streptomyces virginiae TaxID=1961 RepID=UPI0036B85381